MNPGPPGARAGQAPVHLRLARATDAAAIAAIYRPIVEDTVISFEAVAPDAAEMSRRIAGTSPTHPWLVCEADGAIAGYAYASKHREREAYRWAVDTSVYVAASQRRRGIARALYDSLFAILEAQGFAAAFAGIALPNPASVALHEAAGFEPLGVYRRVGYKRGGWHDVGWWQRRLWEADGAPPEPLDVGALAARPDWAARLAAGESRIRPRPEPAGGHPR